MLRRIGPKFGVRKISPADRSRFVHDRVTGIKCTARKVMHFELLTCHGCRCHHFGQDPANRAFAIGRNHLHQAPAHSLFRCTFARLADASHYRSTTTASLSSSNRCLNAAAMGTYQMQTCSRMQARKVCRSFAVNQPR